MLSQFPTKPNLQTKQNQYKLPIFINRYFMLNIIYIYMPSKISLAVLCLLLALMQTSYAKFKADQYTFAAYKHNFNKVYESQSDELRKKQCFQKNMVYLKNMARANIIVPPNRLLDLCDQQKQVLTGLRHPEQEPQRVRPQLNRFAQAPDNFDYRDLGKVSGVRDQGNCGSCWAFSATAQYESLLLMLNQYSEDIDLSQQYVLDCTSGSSCNGGWPHDAIDAIKNQGIPLQSSVPYQAQDLNTCSTPASKIKIEGNIITNNYRINQLSTYEELKLLLIERGPQQVAVKAGGDHFYYPGASGYINNCPTSYAYTDHVVLLVGYDDTHWIIKNSWGQGWGASGFAYIPFNNDCGILGEVWQVQIDAQFNPEPSPEPGPNPNPYPDNQVTLIIKMRDDYKDGWQGNVLGLKQGNEIVATFGEGFLEGKQHEKFVVIPTNIQTSIVVVQYGSFRYQMEFSIAIDDGETIYQRKIGQQFASDYVFDVFCIGYCSNPDLVFFMTLFDSWCDGWDANTMQIIQGDNVIEVGGQFTEGSRFGPISFTLQYGIVVQIRPSNFADYTEEIGFVIRDEYGYQVSRRDPGTAYTQNQLLGTFIPGGVNFLPVRTVSKTDSPAKDTNKKNRLQSTDSSTNIDQNTIQDHSQKALVVAIICLSLILSVLLISLTLVLKKIRQINRESEKKFIGTSESMETPNELVRS